MRVTINIVVDVDQAAWANTYGISAAPASVREDVKRWATNAVTEHPEDLITIVRSAR